MSEKSRTDLNTEAGIIRDETSNNANTATRVGTHQVNQNDSNFNKTTDTSDNLTEGSTKLLLTTGERTKLGNTTNTNSGDNAANTSSVAKALFDANTILQATADNTPVAITVAEQRLLGRITGGNITALTAAQIKTLLSIPAGSDTEIQYNDSGDLNGASELKYDNVNDRLQIGTVSPEKKVHISSTSSSLFRIERTSAGGGATMELKNGDGFIGSWSLSGLEVMTFNMPGTADAFTILNNGNLGILETAPATALHVGGGVTQNELSADPSDPAEGQNVTWQSDGTGSGDDGDIMMKITAGASTKTITLVDFSTF